jgi:protein-disulfide isomerase
MDTNRRRLLAGAAATLAVVGVTTAWRARADDAFQFPLIGDDGSRVPNYRLPSQLNTETVPGILWVGSSSPDVILAEFFDYNCPYCRAAAKDIKALVERDRDLRLGLVNNAIISPGSAQAAKVMLAVAKLNGAKAAYAFHERLLGTRGPVDGPVALDLAAKMGFDRKLLESTGDTAPIGDLLRAQTGLASSLGFVATPSFMIAGVGMLGYPGPKAIGRIVASVRKCEKVVCG